MLPLCTQGSKQSSQGRGEDQRKWLVSVNEAELKSRGSNATDGSLIQKTLPNVGESGRARGGRLGSFSSLLVSFPPRIHIVEGLRLPRKENWTTYTPRVNLQSLTRAFRGPPFAKHHFVKLLPRPLSPPGSDSHCPPCSPVTLICGGSVVGFHFCFYFCELPWVTTA